MAYVTRFCWLLVVLCCTACSAEDEPFPEQAKRLVLQDLTVCGFRPWGSERQTESVLETGSRMSLYATGGVVGHGSLYTWDNGYWRSEDAPLCWTSKEAAHLRAYSPPLLTTTTEWYDEDQRLTDWLVADQEVAYLQEARLQFSHLFARIDFQVDERLNLFVESLRLTSSVRLEGIDPGSGQATLSSDELPTVCWSRQDNARYPLLVPYGQALNIHVEMTTRQGIHFQADTPTFQPGSGLRYVCPLSSRQDLGGIYSTEDFIAFSHLMNGEAYGDRRLDEFGVTDAEGRTTYRLCKDLTFTKEEAAQVKMIGPAKKYFADIFDGQGYTISGLTLVLETNDYYLGLFGGINSKGIVKNLRLYQCSVGVNGGVANHFSAGLFCGANYGRIDGCQAVDCYLSVADAGYIGGITGLNQNLVVNCGVESCTLKNTHTTQYVAGIACLNDCEVNNCYVANCKLIGQNLGNICCMATNSPKSILVAQVCAANNTAEGGNLYAILRTNNQSSLTTLRNCFYNKGTALSGLSGQCKYTTSLTYNNTSIVELLNQATAAQRDQYREWTTTGETQVPLRLVAPQ